MPSPRFKTLRKDFQTDGFMTSVEFEVVEALNMEINLKALMDNHILIHESMNLKNWNSLISNKPKTEITEVFGNVEYERIMLENFHKTDYSGLHQYIEAFSTRFIDPDSRNYNYPIRDFFELIEEKLSSYYPEKRLYYILNMDEIVPMVTPLTTYEIHLTVISTLQFSNEIIIFNISAD